MRNIQLSLKRKWFEMTKAGIKTEDYREINEYWVKRLTQYDFKSGGLPIEKAVDILRGGSYAYQEWMLTHLDGAFAYPKVFKTNTLTLGYPSANDTDRIIKFEHAGIEIRTGNPEWGAEEGKLYFVIKHGKRI